MATEQQINAFNILRTRPGVFTPQQLQAIGILEQRGELNDNILNIMSKVKQPGQPTLTQEPTPEGVATPEEPRELELTGFPFPPGKGDKGEIKEAWKALAKTHVRPTLQGVGSTVGAAVGLAAGAPTGPGAAVTTVAGGMLGFAIADDAADILENWLGVREPQSLMFELEEAGKNIYEGAKWEIAGGAAGSAVGMTGKAVVKSKAGTITAKKWKELMGKIPPLRAKAAKKKVGEVLGADLGNNRQVLAENIEQAQLLEEMIPGLKFEYGKLTGDAKFQAYEKQLSKDFSTFEGQLANQQAANKEAIRKFIEQQKGKPSEDLAKQFFSAEQEFLEQGTLTARKHLTEAQAGLRQPKDAIVEAGETIREAAKAEKAGAKKASGALFDAIGDEVAPTDSIMKKIESLTKAFDRSEAVGKNFPVELKDMYVDLLDAAGKPGPSGYIEGLGDISKARRTQDAKPMSYKDINNYRKKLSATLNNMQADRKRNKLAEKRIMDVIDTIESVLDKGVKTDKTTAKAVREARKIHKTTVYEPFETGRIKETIEDELSDAKVALSYFQKGAEGTVAARQFKSALGKNEVANKALRTAIKQDFLDKVVNPVTKEVDPKKLIKWKSDHRYALKELDMLDDFADVTKARQGLDEALELEGAFKKSIAADVLEADPGDAIRQVMGGKNPGQKTAELMRKMHGNKQAVEGLQNAFIEELQRIDISDVKKIDSFMHTNRNVYKSLFKQAPNKLKAMEMYQTAIKRLFPKKQAITGDMKDYESIINMLARPIRMSRGKINGVLFTVGRVLQHTSRNKARALIAKASLDPNFAFDFISQMRTYEPSNFKKFLERSLITLGEVETANREE